MIENILAGLSTNKIFMAFIMILNTIGGRYITNEATGSAINTKTLNVSNLPTSAAGLSSGQLWVRNEKDGTKSLKSA